MKSSRFKFLKDAWRQVRQTDYSDLSFLYIACLLTIAIVCTVFRVSEFYLHRQQSTILQAIQQIGVQRELVSEFERLIAFAQNRTSPQYPVTARLLSDIYLRLETNHHEIGPKLGMLKEPCENRQCSVIFRRELFNLPSANVVARLNSTAATPDEHNRLLQQLYDIAVYYRMVLKDTMAMSFDVIHKRNSRSLTFDFMAYITLLTLLLVQAVYVFRPAIRRLNASLSTRSDFLSRISHEIRNPMNSIIGMADILKSTKLNYEQQQFADNLVRSGHALLDMLNNLIDSSAIEGGKLKLKTDAFDLFRTIDRCLHLVSLQAHHKNINMYLHMKPEISSRLIGDGVRLEQVLINLLNNAVKFTEQGHVSLSIEVMADDHEATTLKFSVDDTGIGIKSTQLSEIFESFVQADSSIKRRYGGSGLGLSIARELIRLMGGDLQVTSELGHGSCFHFTVSFQKQFSYEHLNNVPLKTLSDTSFIFLVSAAESNAYQKTFQCLNAPVAILNSSQELRAYFGGSGERDVHQVLIDDSIGIISMITCRNLAAESGLGGRAVALIRSNFTKENMDLLKRNGFTRFMIKPLKPWDLLTLPSEVHEEGQRAMAAGSDVVNKLKEKNLRVLLVDDSNDNLFLLKEVVKPLASLIHFAENGLEAIEKFAANSYDVVFMDIQMPVMDGYTAIRRMRVLEKDMGRSIPIFAVTAHAGLVDAQKCREAGFTDRIVKPVVRSDIYKSLSQAFAVDTEDSDFDHDSGVPAKYMARLMPTFIKSRREDLARLRNALDAFDFETAQSLGHKMKGSSASYGFADASELSHKLESIARGADADGCRKIADELEGIFAREGAKFDL